MDSLARKVRDTRQVSANQTLFLGMLSTLIVLLIGFLIRLSFSPTLEFERWMGDLFINRRDNFGWNFGFSALIFEGAVIALFYGSLFRSAHRSGPIVGLHVSLIHALITGFALSLTRFGAFGFELGTLNATLIFASHLIYGLCLGSLFDFAATKRAYPIRIN